MVANILSINEIISDPKIRNGRPVIAGTEIMVMTIVVAHASGDKLSYEEIAQHYGISLGQVHAAIAYYYLHQTEMDEQFQRETAETQQLLDEIEKQGKLLRLD